MTRSFKKMRKTKIIILPFLSVLPEYNIINSFLRSHTLWIKKKHDIIKLENVFNASFLLLEQLLMLANYKIATKKKDRAFLPNDISH